VNVAFKEGFAEDLRAVRGKSLLRRVRAVIEQFERAQRPSEVAGLRKLKGGGNYYRVRVGEYRV
jgi:mRNA interferase RelE/StbE